MKTTVLTCGVFSIDVAEAWEDITATLDNQDVPFTIADPVSGVGALQFSPAIYKAGQLPQIMPQDLSELLDEFASSRELNGPFDRSTYSGKIAIEGASFRDGADFVRVWYASDGKNVLLVTYVCEWESRDRETQQREMAVRSIRVLSE